MSGKKLCGYSGDMFAEREADMLPKNEDWAEQVENLAEAAYLEARAGGLDVREYSGVFELRHGKLSVSNPKVMRKTQPWLSL